MGDIVIQVQDLGKRYRLGVRERSDSSLFRRLRKTASSPFDYLLASLRKPLEQETLWALRHASFEVKRGEVLGVIGRNGAGKSTLLKVLSRITEPTEGQVNIKGRVASLLEVGTGFHPELTGRENIYLNGAILGMRKAEIDRKFDEIVDFSGVEKFIDTPVKRYSSGMSVRLAFAVAAHLEPEILLVDEVLAVGDLEFQRKSLNKMGDVTRSEGRTVLLVSHQMASIASLCPTALLLDRGVIAMIGPTPDVISRYVSSVRETSGEVGWDNPNTAPGDGKIRLHAVRTMAAGGGVTSDFDMEDEVVVQVAYWMLLPGMSPHVNVVLHDDHGVYVLQSANLPPANSGVDTWFGRTFPQGLFVTECRLPPNLLNRRTYRITVEIGAVIGRQASVAEKDVVSFTVHDRRGNEYYARWAGAVHPKLAWSTWQADGMVPAGARVPQGMGEAEMSLTEKERIR